MPEPLTIRVYAVEGRVVFAAGGTRPRRIGCDQYGGLLPDGELLPAVQTNAGLQPTSAMYRNSLAAKDLSLTPPAPQVEPASNEASQ